MESPDLVSDESPQTTRNASVEDLLKIARIDLSRNSLGAAEKALEQAIVANSQEPEAFHLLGLVYSKKGKFKKAILAFQRALALEPGHTEAAIALSSLYSDVGRYKEGSAVYQAAKKRLEKTIPGHDPKINRTLADRHRETGTLYLRYERHQEALHEFTKALNLEPDHIGTAISIAKCMAKSSDRPGAIAFLRKMLMRFPRQPEAKIQLGILLHSEQDLVEARREWEEALEMDPENKSAKMYLSMLEYEPSGSRLQ